jgi:hypothetical protein
LRECIEKIKEFQAINETTENAQKEAYGVGVFKVLIRVNNLEKNDNVIISMPNKIYSNNGNTAPKNYS